MKILILVLSYNQPPFDALMKAQQETWDSVDVDGVKTIYYYGTENKERKGCRLEDLDKKNYSRTHFELMTPCTDSYYYMAGKFKESLEFIKRFDEADSPMFDYDIIFRTNSSSYVNKKRLLEFAETLPKEKLYAGWTLTDSEDHGGKAVSGAGIWLSRDTAEILRENIDPNFEMEEDIYCGRILRKHGIVALDDKTRYDYHGDKLPDMMARRLATKYHIRFKTGDRMFDAKNMKFVHNKIIQHG